MNKALSLLTIAKKAGKIQLGMDPSKDACRSGKACLVLIAKDLSLKSRKEMLYFCNEECVSIADFDVSIDEIWQNLAKKAGVVAILDTGFAKKLRTFSEISMIDNK